MKDLFGFGTLILRHVEVVSFLSRLLRLWNADVTYGGCSLLRGFDRRVYLQNNADAWWCELIFEGRQRRCVQSTRSVAWHGLKMFDLLSIERKLL